MPERQYSEAELREVVAREIKGYAEGQLVETIKKTVNGLKAHVESLGRDLAAHQRQAENWQREAATVAEDLGLVRLEKEDKAILMELLEERRLAQRRTNFYNSALGRTATLVGIVAAILVIASSIKNLL